MESILEYDGKEETERGGGCGGGNEEGWDGETEKRKYFLLSYTEVCQI